MHSKLLILYIKTHLNTQYVLFRCLNKHHANYFVPFLLAYFYLKVVMILYAVIKYIWQTSVVIVFRKLRILVKYI